MPRKKRARVRVDNARDIKGYLPAGGWFTSTALAEHLDQEPETTISHVIYGENDDTKEGCPCLKTGGHFKIANDDMAQWIQQNAKIQKRPRKKGGNRRCPRGKGRRPR
ncbi:hypothetical protein LCGC14_2441060 [marine sediment metagenome]|uniref:Helix-turn-helix domain-containing protein n=1 Tax=marine sediment metagenome TaxID=412755 RepID=A0A0F9BIW8_9ZZZZ